jgi:hypothetical protein
MIAIGVFRRHWVPVLWAVETRVTLPLSAVGREELDTRQMTTTRWMSGADTGRVTADASDCRARRWLCVGEYFVLCNLDKKEIIVPGGFGHGNKPGDMVQHAPGGVLHGLLHLLLLGGSGWAEAERLGHLMGRWAGDRIAVIGDYFDGDIGGIHWSGDETAERKYGHAGWVNITEHVARAIGGQPDSRWVGLSVMQADGTAVSAPSSHWE